MGDERRLAYFADHEVGPVRHRRADRISGHVMIAVMAYNLGAWVARKAGMTLEQLTRVFANLRVQEVQVGGTRYWERVELDKEHRAVLAALGYDEPPKRFTVSVE